MDISNNKKVSDLTLEELFPRKLTDTVCINIHKEREVWVATLMCAQYLESTVDSIIVRDEDFKPVGIVGGYDLLDHLRRNPTRDSQYRTKVGEIMLKDFPQVEKETKFRDLMEIWKNSRRAFAIIINEFGDCSTVSARRMIEVGTRCKTDISVSSMPKKKIVTFRQDDPLSRILDLMYENKTRKLILENSNQFISDRLILGEISKMLRFQTDIDYFLDIPANRFKLENAKVITEDVRFDQLCLIMENMDHPYVVYKDTVVSPWDVCLTLLSEDLTMPLETGHPMMRMCPHCGKYID
ncbi:CBS domain-containing protein [Nitrososphaera sp.]|uniref:CBS domain-containing protein n=1 Tax=Nitrososphaera sp. TaxID=1971748 RepID=UPI00307EF7D1